MAKTKLTKGLLTREEATKLAPDYVTYVEKQDYAMLDKFMPKFYKMRKGQAVVTCSNGQYVRAKVSSVDKTSFKAMNSDGPVIRVSNGEFSWRVDGCDYAYPID